MSLKFGTQAQCHSVTWGNPVSWLQENLTGWVHQGLAFTSGELCFGMISIVIVIIIVILSDLPGGVALCASKLLCVLWLHLTIFLSPLCYWGVGTPLPSIVCPPVASTPSITKLLGASKEITQVLELCLKQPSVEKEWGTKVFFNYLRHMNSLYPICGYSGSLSYCLFIDCVPGCWVQDKLEVTTLLLKHAGTKSVHAREKQNSVMQIIYIQSEYIHVQINLSTLYFVRISHQCPST